MSDFLTSQGFRPLCTLTWEWESGSSLKQFVVLPSERDESMDFPWPRPPARETLAEIQEDLGKIKLALANLQQSVTLGIAKIMSDFTNLNAQITLEQSEVAQIVVIVTNLEGQIAALTAAAGTGDQAAIDAATAALQTSIDSLKTSIASAAPPAPPVTVSGS